MLCQPACLPGLFSFTASTSWIPIPNMVSLWGHPFFRCQEITHSKWSTTVPLRLALHSSSCLGTTESRRWPLRPPALLKFVVSSSYVLSGQCMLLLRTKYEDYAEEAGAKEVSQSTAGRRRASLRGKGSRKRKIPNNRLRFSSLHGSVLCSGVLSQSHLPASLPAEVALVVTNHLGVQTDFFPPVSFVETVSEPAKAPRTPKMSANGSTVAQLLWQRPVCSGWRQGVEGALYHLANCFLLMGFMAGSGVYGCFYLFGILGPGFLCCVLWGWFDACGLDVVLWNVLLTVACLLQLAQLVYRVRVNTLPEEFTLLYRTLCLPLRVPMQVYKEIVHCCHEQVLTLATGQTYAVEGETPINRLSLLLSGR